MSTKLYIENINYNISYFELGSLFSKYGDIMHIDIINDIKSMKSKGSAFIEMADKKCAEKAMSALDKVIWMQRKISVKFAQKEERSNLSNRLYFPI
ncbi:RNA-binding protein [Thiospirochaeta perfilievii]|uniref:RNA-binding protein n=1 Tax=Thiospirochaeta perfilievii TaxID=252967 RepID=A0A5C1Q952_9SPIO|nr:RNA-binding protein [Thiospirochaeta perfilievii]QEN03898.1 RNA-binding protein [Thiospirochaeta perfilievii]